MIETIGLLIDCIGTFIALLVTLIMIPIELFAMLVKTLCGMK